MLKNKFNIPTLVIAALTVCTFSRCSYFKGNGEKDVAQGKPLAKANNITLYSTDLIDIVPKGLSAKDSLDFVKRYVELWVRKEILFSKAVTSLAADQNTDWEEQVESQIKEYKYSLYTYEFEKNYVKSKLDTVIPEKEIVAYYQQNPQNFTLKQNIVRIIYVKLPIDAPKIDKVKNWIKLEKDKHLKELQQYCLQYANEYNFDTGKWIELDNVITATPLRDIANRAEFVSKNKYFESKDENFIYLFNILEYKISNQVSPLQFVRNKVKDVLLNQKKRKLIEEFEQSIYEKAREDKEFEIYL